MNKTIGIAVIASTISLCACLNAYTPPSTQGAIAMRTPAAGPMGQLRAEAASAQGILPFAPIGRTVGSVCSTIELPIALSYSSNCRPGGIALHSNRLTIDESVSNPLKIL
ncbi:MAG: hypothetical protein P4L90_13820 [Rhodopila sp.]|nr:hypothetical protein [Rhodopila sp.]